MFSTSWPFLMKALTKEYYKHIKGDMEDISLGLHKKRMI